LKISHGMEKVDKVVGARLLGFFGKQESMICDFLNKINVINLFLFDKHSSLCRHNKLWSHSIGVNDLTIIGISATQLCVILKSSNYIDGDVTLRSEGRMYRRS